MKKLMVLAAMVALSSIAQANTIKVSGAQAKAIINSPSMQMVSSDQNVMTVEGVYEGKSVKCEVPHDASGISSCEVEDVMKLTRANVKVLSVEGSAQNGTLLKVQKDGQTMICLEEMGNQTLSCPQK